MVAEPSSRGRIRILVVDDRPPIGLALRRLAEGTSDCEVVEVLTRAEGAMAEVVTLGPDVAVLDVRLEGRGAGLDLARTIRRRFPEIKILMYSAYDDYPYVMAAREIGVDGYLLKSSLMDSVIEAARSVVQGDKVFGPGVLERLTPSVSGEGFTSSELEILQLVAAGLGNEEIARRLSVSRSGVGAYVKNITGKLGARNRTDAVVKAMRLGLIVIE